MTGLLPWGPYWGSTAQERARSLPGDELLAAGPPTRVAMTRAVSVEAVPDKVWPWLAQLGRGAGFYSVDWLDNGRRTSARHLVSWIPEPQLGDATAIGYLRHIEPGRSLVWWVDGVQFAGARTRLVSSYLVEPEGRGSRVVSRMSADAEGSSARIALFVFGCIDSIMATRQLKGLRERIEQDDSGRRRAWDRESGARDQYQLYQVIYAGGESAGVPGRESAARWRRRATEDGVLAGDA